MRCSDPSQVQAIFRSENVAHRQEATLKSAEVITFACAGPLGPESAASSTIQVEVLVHSSKVIRHVTLAEWLRHPAIVMFEWEAVQTGKGRPYSGSSSIEPLQIALRLQRSRPNLYRTAFPPNNPRQGDREARCRSAGGRRRRWRGGFYHTRCKRPQTRQRPGTFCRRGGPRQTPRSCRREGWWQGREGWWQGQEGWWQGRIRCCLTGRPWLRKPSNSTRWEGAIFTKQFTCIY